MATHAFSSSVLSLLIPPATEEVDVDEVEDRQVDDIDDDDDDEDGAT